MSDQQGHGREEKGSDTGKKKKNETAQLGIEPRPPTLCPRPAGIYIAGVIPLDHCAFY